jgi:hypothetical protein
MGCKTKLRFFPVPMVLNKEYMAKRDFFAIRFKAHKFQVPKGKENLFGGMH